MQNRFRPVAALILAAILLTPIAPAHPGKAATGGVDVVVEITNLRNTRGKVLACITAVARAFPDCDDDPHSQQLEVAADAAGALRFHNVAPGTYAIAVLHDENDNGRADRALSMIPREGFGFSRDAPVRFGPPSFNSAAIRVEGAALHQTIRMRYML